MSSIGVVNEVGYFRERIRGRDLEVDYVVRSGKKELAIEVTSAETHPRSGLEHFKSKRKAATIVLVGPGDIPVEEFLKSDPETSLKRWRD